MGVRPPNPQFKKSEPVPYILESTKGPDTTKYGSYPIGLIQSAREPYAVEHMYTRYGGLSTRLGTNLGSN